MKISELYYKVAGTGLLSLSVASLLTYALGIFGNALFPGLFFGVAGLVLVSGPQHPPGTLPKDTDERLARLEKALAVTNQELVAAQDEIKQLTDEREFMRQLNK